jgi:hypothetical protein
MFNHFFNQKNTVSLYRKINRKDILLNIYSGRRARKINEAVSKVKFLINHIGNGVFTKDAEN